jgi:hypothetical protein
MPQNDAQDAAREAREAAATRRRWLTLAEILAVVAVLISAATLWNSYRQRTGEEADKSAAKQAAAAASRTLVLRGSPDRGGRRLTLGPVDEAQAIQTQRITFPAALAVSPVETVSDPRIEAGWFERSLLRAIEAAPGDGDRRGDARLPVMVMTEFMGGGAVQRDVALYDIGYRIEGGGLLGGRELRLNGLSRVGSVAPAEAQARLDARWRAATPADDAGNRPR